MNESPLFVSKSLHRESGAGAQIAGGPQGPAETLRPHVLVVDDENLIADSVATILNRNGYDAVPCYSGHDALRYFQERRPDIVVTDVVLPDLDGVQLAKAVRALSPGTRVVLFSGNAATASLLENTSEGGQPFEWLTKPVHPVQLLKALQAQAANGL